MKTFAGKKWKWLAGALALTVLAAGEHAAAPGGASGSAEELSGGTATVFDKSPKAFGFPVAGLSEEHRSAFFVGHSFFDENWVVAPASTSGRDGLGPLFNARSCSSCHARDGRSRPPGPGEPMVSMLIRISVPGKGEHHGPRPDPVYGDQIQGQGIPGVPAEADVFVRYETNTGHYADGAEFQLHKPVYSVTNLGYGPMAKDVMMSARVAPAMYGAGLLEGVPEATLRQLAEQQRRQNGGIAGKVNRVWDQTAGKTAPGRFGWKAEQPTVRQQTAGAFLGDMGITSSLFPNENHTKGEAICTEQASGGHPEVSDKILNDVVIYSRTLAVPARRNWTNAEVRRGETLFAHARCADCHVPKLETGDCAELPELAHQTIRPYTDLLLHDLGEALSDHRPVYDANGRDWRTAPLWGIGLVEKVNGHTRFLHDGRAVDLAEAILWHGGEAEASREKFRTMPEADRNALLAFLKSL
jgi:CxxC motif-containing protein (DUF1111 family)